MRTRRAAQLEAPSEHDLGSRTVQSGVVAVISNVIQMVIGISTTLVLVRLIEPSDYGIYMMGGMLLLVSASVRDLGVGMAVVNASVLTQDRASGLFWFGMAVNALVALILAGMGPVLAIVFDESAVRSILPAIGGVSFVLGVGAVHDALLKRQLRFTAVACRDIGGMLAGGCAAIVVALAGLGYWALVAQQAALAFAWLAASVVAAPWWPSSIRGLRAMLATSEERAHIAHGSRVSSSRFISSLGLIADRFAVGLSVGERPLGLYNQASQWAEFPTRQVYQPLLAVVVSAFSRKQDAAPDRYRRAFRQVLLVLYGVTIPMLMYGAVRGALVIPVILGEQWVDAVPLFRLLCVAFAFRLVVQACKWLYLSESRSADNLRWTLTMTPILVVASGVGAINGAMGVAVGILIAYAVATPIAVWFCTRRTHVEPIDMVRPAARPLVSGAVGVAAAMAITALLPADAMPAARLVVEVAAFTGAVGFAWAWPGRSRDDVLECLGRLSGRFGRLPGRWRVEEQLL